MTTSDLPDCPDCGGPAVLLGALGNIVWLRCRDCGSTYAEDVITGEAEELDE